MVLTNPEDNDVQIALAQAKHAHSEADGETKEAEAAETLCVDIELDHAEQSEWRGIVSKLASLAEKKRKRRRRSAALFSGFG